MKRFVILLASISLLIGATLARGESPREEFLRTLPTNQDDPHCRAILIDLWTHASHKPLGKEDDEVQIRMLSLPDNVHIATVRWISPQTAVAQCEHDRVRYLAFFIKEEAKWAFVRQYSMGRSKSS